MTDGAIILWALSSSPSQLNVQYIRLCQYFPNHIIQQENITQTTGNKKMASAKSTLEVDFNRLGGNKVRLQWSVAMWTWNLSVNICLYEKMVYQKQEIR